MFTQIKDPNSLYCYGTGCAMVLGTMMENVTLDCLLLRNANPKIRGVIYSTANAFGYLGLLLFSMIGGILYDKYGAYMPFMFVGACDFVFGLAACLLGLSGVVKNDLKKTKL